MRRAWDGWCFPSSLPFIKCGHGSILGEDVEYGSERKDSHGFLCNLLLRQHCCRLTVCGKAPSLPVRNAE